MDKEQESGIRGISRAIDHARAQKMRELMDDYDATIYRPAKYDLRERCGEQGHGRIDTHDNGIGWTFEYCSLCGFRAEATFYNSFDIL